MDSSTYSKGNCSDFQSYDVLEDYSELESPVSTNANYTLKNSPETSGTCLNYSLGAMSYSDANKSDLENMAGYLVLPDYQKSHASINPWVNYQANPDLIASLFENIRRQEKNCLYRKRKKPSVLSLYHVNHITESFLSKEGYVF